MKFRHVLLCAASAYALNGTGAQAQDAAKNDPATIVVRALPLDREASEVAAPVAALDGDALVHERRATLGETLAGIPGVNMDSFGAGASRPVIRGQTAPRVKVLSDSSEVLDASQVSPDHAVVGEPLLLRRIEVLRGPSALLYGGGAIGGAINLIDDKIPTAVPENGIEGVAEFRAGTGDDELAGVAGITVGTGNVAFHAEGVLRDTNDYKVPGWTDSHVDGSYNETSTGSVGASIIGDNGYFGVAYTRQRSEYGIPGHSHEYESCHPHGSHLHCGGHDHGDDDHDHDHGDEDHHDVPFVKLRSDRFDIRGEYRNPFAGIEKIKLRAGVTDYEHDEIEGEEVATTFRNKGWDGRLEVEHSPIGRLSGVVGVQYSDSEFSALGEEAFLPESDTRNVGFFILEELRLDNLRLEVAARYESQKIKPVNAAAASHDPFSVSASAVWDIAADYSLALSLSRSQRAPTAQELFARGVHLATNTYEIGDAALTKETSHAADLSFRKTGGATTFDIGVFINAVDRYICADTLDQFEDFRLIRYAQNDVRFIGIDGEITHRFSGALALSVFGDFVRGKLTQGGGDLPRIPAGRLGAKAEGSWNGLSAELEFYHVFEQGKIASFETATAGYDMLNATLAYQIGQGRTNAQIYVRGTNLLNELAFNHASFITNVAPLPGRRITFGVRGAF